MSRNLEHEISALDGKQAIHYLTLISNGVPPTTDYSLEELRKEAAKADVAQPHDLPVTAEDATFEGAQAYALAKSLLTALADSPGGDQIVQAALDEPQSQTADFGLLSGPAMLLAWLVITSKIDINIGKVHIHKEGLSSADQVSLAKKLLPSVLRAFSGA